MILAMGAEHKKLGVPGEEELGGRGVSYCATCDAAFYKDRTTIIVGGGDSAMEEAIFLAKFSSQGHDRQPPRRVPRLEDHARARARDREHRVPDAVRRRGVPGRRERACWTARDLRNTETGETRELPMAGAFIAIGHEPQSEIVDGLVEIDDEGYVKTEGKSTRTNLPGVFAAGDLVDHTYRQAVTAAGSGCQAALDAEWYLRDNPAVPTPEGPRGHRRPGRSSSGRRSRAPSGGARRRGPRGLRRRRRADGEHAPDRARHDQALHRRTSRTAGDPGRQHVRRRGHGADDRLARGPGRARRRDSCSSSRTRTRRTARSPTGRCTGMSAADRRAAWRPTASSRPAPRGQELGRQGRLDAALPARGRRRAPLHLQHVRAARRRPARSRARQPEAVLAKLKGALARGTFTGDLPAARS